MKRKYLIIADDLTGANDTGIQFLKAGYRASVTFDPAALESMEDHGAIVLDTESRNIPEEAAAAIIKKAVPFLAKFMGKRVFYKKVDSTLRGNIRAEVAVLREELGFPLTIFTPAFPENRRTVKDGLLFLDGIPVDRTEMGRDPRKPVLTSSLAESLLGPRAGEGRAVSLEEIRAGRIPALLEESGRRGVFCFDAERDEDLSVIARDTFIAAPAEDVLWVGSAGLAEGMMNVRLPVLLVAGSLSAVSARQARYVMEGGHVRPLLPDISALLGDPEREEAALAEKAAELLGRGENVLISSAVDEEQIAAGRRAGKPELIGESLARIVARILKRTDIAGLFATGGEIAIKIVQALGGGGVSLLEEVEPGIPLVRLMGGRAEGLPIITKAGGFGSEDAMKRCIEVLTSPSHGFLRP
ncbi:MAG: four-carbon acid sugar kinase family protein [Synergistaceae bacterium]|nr:four-carbon acid sugar kinase family protein [Synergistaceae bacterium]